MEIKKFRSIVKPGSKLNINDKELVVKEVVKFRFDDGNFYIKCFLSDDYVLADDLNENIYVLVKEVKTQFVSPFPEELDYDGNKFKYLYTAHAIAEEIEGEEIFAKGDGERFWDYVADDNSYLSLGVNDTTNERLDFYGKIVAVDALKIK